MPAFACPTRAIVSGFAGSRRPSSVLFLFAFRICWSWIAKDVAIVFRAPAQSSTVHFDQVEAELTNEAQVDGCKDLTLDFFGDRVERVARGCVADDVGRVQQQHRDPADILGPPNPPWSPGEPAPLADGEQSTAGYRRDHKLFQVIECEACGGEQLGER